MDSYNLSVVARLVGHEGLEKDKQGGKSVRPGKGLSGAEVCWTPDSCFVMSGEYLLLEYMSLLSLTPITMHHES
jgi:hypothetical protein